MTTAIQMMSRLIFDLRNYHKISDSLGTKQKCARVCVCVCVLDGEGSRVVAGAALVVVWTAVYLTSYSVCLTGFQEPLSPPYTCHTGLKNVWE